MATRQIGVVGKWALAPSVAALAAWSFVPLALTFYFAFLFYNLQDPDNTRWAGFSNFYYFFKDPYFLKDLINTLLLVGSVIVTTVVGGVLLALLLDRQPGRHGPVRLRRLPDRR